MWHGFEQWLFSVFAHARQCRPSLVEFFREDVHDLETEMMLLAEQIEQALAWKEYEIGVVGDFGGEAVGGLGQGGGKAEERTRSQVSPGKGGKISLKAKSHGAVCDEENAGDRIATAEEIIAAGQMHEIANRDQMRAKFGGGPQDFHVAVPHQPSEALIKDR